MKAPKISFCTVCMNRLHHLQQTLPSNIEDSKLYGNCEFILLDYNSQDGLEAWILEHCRHYLESGILKYYKMVEPVPAYFHRSHSRNVSFRLATGDILCNVDADHFIEEGLAPYLAREMADAEAFLTVNRLKVSQDNVGRVCVRASDFYKVGGYDEAFEEYGYEDVDLCVRLRMAGLEERYLPTRLAYRTIPHPNEQRVENERSFNEVNEIYIRYISPVRSELLFLYGDQNFERGTLFDDMETYGRNLPVIEEKKWQTGRWSSTQSQLYLEHPVLAEQVFQKGECTEQKRPGLWRGELFYYKVTSSRFFDSILFRRSSITNNQALINRKASGKYKANKSRYGLAKVLKNNSTIVELA